MNKIKKLTQRNILQSRLVNRLKGNANVSSPMSIYICAPNTNSCSKQAKNLLTLYLNSISSSSSNVLNITNSLVSGTSLIILLMDNTSFTGTDQYSIPALNAAIQRKIPVVYVLLPISSSKRRANVVALCERVPIAISKQINLQSFIDNGISSGDNNNHPAAIRDLLELSFREPKRSIFLNRLSIEIKDLIPVAKTISSEDQQQLFGIFADFVASGNKSNKFMLSSYEAAKKQVAVMKSKCDEYEVHTGEWLFADLLQWFHAKPSDPHERSKMQSESDFDPDIDFDDEYAQLEDFNYNFHLKSDNKEEGKKDKRPASKRLPTSTNSIISAVSEHNTMVEKEKIGVEGVPSWIDRVFLLIGLPDSGKTVFSAKISSNTIDYKRIGLDRSLPAVISEIPLPNTLATRPDDVEVHYYDNLPEVNVFVSGYYFFDKLDEETNNLITFVKVLHVMLAQEFPQMIYKDYPVIPPTDKKLTKRGKFTLKSGKLSNTNFLRQKEKELEIVSSEESLQGMDFATLIDTLIVKPLKKVPESSNNSKSRRLILVDGIDELPSSQRALLTSWISAHWKKDMPSWLGIVITSRPDNELIEQFSLFSPSVQPYNLSVFAYKVRDDIRRTLSDAIFKHIATKDIIEDSVNNFGADSSYEFDGDNNSQLEKLVDKCSGSYAFAKYISRAISAGINAHPQQTGEEENWTIKIDSLSNYDKAKLSAIWKLVENLPDGLSGMYNSQATFIESTLGKGVSNLLFALVLAARVPLSIHIWEDVLQKRINRNNRVPDSRAIIASTQHVLVFKNGCLSFCSKSVREWVRRKKIPLKYRTKAHSILANWSKEYLQRAGILEVQQRSNSNSAISISEEPVNFEKKGSGSSYHFGLIGHLDNVDYAFDVTAHYAMKQIFYHFCMSNEFLEAMNLLLNFDWLMSRLDVSVDIFEDMEAFFLNNNRHTEVISKVDARAVRLLASVIRLARHILGESSYELASQILARVPERSDGSDPAAIRLRSLALEFKPGIPWWRPLTSTLELADSPLIQVISAHDKPIDTVSVAPDCRSLASGGRDGKIFIWDVQTGKPLQCCTPSDVDYYASHPNNGTKDVNSVAFSSDGRYVAAGYDDGLIIIWSALSGRCSFKLNHHEKRVWSVVFSPDGKYLVSVSEDNTLAIFETPRLEDTFKDRTSLTLHSKKKDTKKMDSGMQSEQEPSPNGIKLNNNVSTMAVGGHNNRTRSRSRKKVQLQGTRTRARGTSISAFARGFHRSLRRRKSLVDPNPPATTTQNQVNTSSKATRKISQRRRNNNPNIRRSASFKLKLVASIGPFLDAANSVSFSHDAKSIVVGFDDKAVRSFSVVEALMKGRIRTPSNNRTKPTTSSFGNASALSGNGSASTGNSQITGHVSLPQLEDESNSVLGRFNALSGQGSFTNRSNRLRLYSLQTDTDVDETPANDNPREIAWNWQGVDRALESTRTFWGHLERVRSVQFSPKTSKFIVSCGDDNCAILWTSDTPVLRHRLSGHDGKVYGVGFSPSETYIASASADRSVKLWECSSGACLYTFVGHADPTMKALFIDNDRIVSASLDKTIRIWNVRTALSSPAKTNGAIVSQRKVQGHTKWVVSVAVSPCGKYIVTGSQDMSVCVWDSSIGEVIHKLLGHTNTVWHVVVCPRSKLVASGSPDTSLRLWDIDSGQNVHIMLGHRGSVSGIAFAHSKQLIATGSMDMTASVWNTNTGALVMSYIGHTSTIAPVCFSRDDRLLVTGSSDGTCRVWDVFSGGMLHILGNHKDLIRAISISNDNRIVVTGCDDGYVLMWNIAEDRLMYNIKTDGKDHQLRAAVITEDSEFVVTTDRLNNILVWSTKSGLKVENSKRNGNRRINNMGSEFDLSRLRIPFPAYETDGMQGLPLQGTGLHTYAPRGDDGDELGGVGFSVDIGTLNTRKLTTIDGKIGAVAEGDKIHILKLESGR